MDPPSIQFGSCRSGFTWKAGQAYQRNPIDWYLVDSMHDHHMAECMQSYVCLVLISVRDKVMVAGYFTLETSLVICNTHVTDHPLTVVLKYNYNCPIVSLVGF